jgi:2',3'-cyclic-nucleotide 2'-phosphodiesterase (5'-nucleotidase family)
MIITRKAGILLFSALILAALVFTGCSPDPEPDSGPDWGKVADWDGTDTTTVLGTASGAISGADIRYKETPLGNLIADGIAEYARFTSGETVDFAMLNGQNVQGFTEIPQGDITLTNLTSGNALGDTLYLVTYTGVEIETVINIFVKSDQSGRWSANCIVLVSSGVSYSVTDDDDNPETPPKATNIKVNSTAIDPANTEKTYRVAVGNFMAGPEGSTGGGANFVNYGTNKISYDDTLKQAVAKYILAKGTIDPPALGRVTGEVPALP